jgi:hypothetical protein
MTDSVSAKVLILGTCSFSVFFTLAALVINGLVGGYNTIIEANLASMDTSNNISMILQIWKLSPAIFLVGLVLWMVERGKGTNIPPSLFYMYESVLILSIIYSIIWLICYGTVYDAITYYIIQNPGFAVADPKLDCTTTALRMGQLIYLICDAPAYLGCLLFMIHPIVVQSDSMIYGADGTGDTGEFVTNFEQI